MEHIDHTDHHKTFDDIPYLRKIFQAAITHKTSDLIMKGGQQPKLRLRGELKSLNMDPLDPIEFEEALKEGVTGEQWEHYLEYGSIDIAENIAAKEDGARHRFRINMYRTRGVSALAARLISNNVPPFEKLYLPPVMKEISELHQGLVLLCGVTGSGKSTTIASMLQYINQNRACHIVTIEDPVEYLFDDDKALISQREVGIDVPDFATGLRALVRENPDVVLIGEMRDRETFEAALQAAETGHLVFGTIHASSTSQAFGRIYDLFPAEERDAVRNMLAFQMQAFVYQKLLPTLKPDVPRVPTVEVLLQTPPTRKFILEGREHELNDIIKEAKNTGMQTLTESLVQLVNDEMIHPKVAYDAAHSPEEVKMRLRGIG